VEKKLTLSLTGLGGGEAPKKGIEGRGGRRFAENVLSEKKRQSFTREIRIAAKEKCGKGRGVTKGILYGNSGPLGNADFGVIGLKYADKNRDSGELLKKGHGKLLGGGPPWFKEGAVFDRNLQRERGEPKWGSSKEKSWVIETKTQRSIFGKQQKTGWPQSEGNYPKRELPMGGGDTGKKSQGGEMSP